MNGAIGNLLAMTNHVLRKRVNKKLARVSCSLLTACLMGCAASGGMTGTNGVNQADIDRVNAYFKHHAQQTDEQKQAWMEEQIRKGKVQMPSNFKVMPNGKAIPNRLLTEEQKKQPGYGGPKASTPKKQQTKTCPKGFDPASSRNRGLGDFWRNFPNEIVLDYSYECLRSELWNKHYLYANDLMQSAWAGTLLYADEMARAPQFAYTSESTGHRVEFRSRRYSNDGSCVFYDMIQMYQKKPYATGVTRVCFSRYLPM
jgi:hypothetical protein